MISVDLHLQAVFTILLVEDEDNLRDVLQKVIERKMSGVSVDFVGTVSDALDRLSGTPSYDLGILDIRIPWHRGLQPEADPRVADRLKELGIPSIVMTGFRDSADVESYLEKRSLTDPPLAVITKRVTSDFVTEVLGELQKWFVKQASARITVALDRVFGRCSDFVGVHSGTAPLMSLHQDIQNYWPFLDAATREVVQTRFHLQEKDGRIVRLMPFAQVRPK